MRFFIDGADAKQVRDCVGQGIIDGVTTAGRQPRDRLAGLCGLVKGPVSAEVMASDPDGMLQEGRALASIAPNIVVKLPLTTDGLKVVRLLSGEGVRTGVSLCFNPVQALLAARAGAGFISPSLGRLDDVAVDGMDLVRKIVAIYRTYEFKTEVLVASVRNPNDIVDAALAGAEVATVPYAVLQQLVQHPVGTLSGSP